jgi:hypothetical protein
MYKIGELIICAALAAIVVAPASAGVIFTTDIDPNAANGADPLYSSSSKSILGTDSQGRYVLFAEVFTLASDSVATDVLAPLARFSNSFATNAVDFFIVADNAGLPNTDSVGNPTSPLYSGETSTTVSSTTPSIFDVTLTGSATLTAGTDYWLISKLPGTVPCTGTCPTQDVNWYRNPSSSKPAGYLSSNLDQPWLNPGNPTFAFTIEGTAPGDSPATPEPATYFLMGVGLVATSWLTRRRAARTL